MWSKGKRAQCAALLGLSSLVPLAGTAQAIDRDHAPTPAQREAVVRALIDRGADRSTAMAVADDVKAAAQVPIATEVQTAGDVPPTWRQGVPPADGPESIQAAVGSCAGTSSWAAVTVYELNNFNVRMASIRLQVNWCYKGGRVTYAAPDRRYTVYGAALGTWYWQGWSDFNQYLYTSGGHVNGGAMTNTQGHFDICVLKYGCFDNADPYAEVRTYWNGTWLGSGRA